MSSVPDTPTVLTFARVRQSLRQLYLGSSPRSDRFRYALFGFDLGTVVFIVATSFLPANIYAEWLGVVIGLLILADFSMRMLMSRRPLREFVRLHTWTDLIAVISFLAPFGGGALGFLRILRTLRLLSDLQMLTQLRDDWGFFKRNEEIIIAVANLAVFVFIMTGVVYETQKFRNPQIGNYADALYFTVTALTTTGFGDITLPGTTGRLITVVIMIFGVTLFFNLAKALFAPTKVRFSCPTCALQRHDVDAVHCKACGTLLCIPDEGTN